MSYQPPNQHYGPPQPPTGQWGVPPRPPKKSKLVPILICAAAFIITLGIIGAIAGANTKTSGAAGATPDTTQAAVTPVTSAMAKKAPPPAKAPASKVVLRESGSGIKSTVTFTVAGDWDLKYSYDCTSFGFAGNFVVTGSGLGDLFVNELGKSGADATHLHSGGKMHLDINSECAWKITVTDV